MFSKVYSGGILGIEGYLVNVEADVSDGLPCFVMTGYLAAEVREAQDRVRTALRNSGFRLPVKRITVNLSPADVRKAGTAFDLPVAIAMLASFGVIEPSVLKKSFFVGELGLNGRIKEIHGTLSLVAAAKQAGLARCFLPDKNVLEGSMVPGIEVFGVEDITELVYLLNHPEELEASPPRDVSGELCEQERYDVDYADVNGQLLIKRATEIAVAGMHNILVIGPAGTGKSMVAQRIPTIMPKLSTEENLEISKIYSICGLLPADKPLLSKRPFRSPHHTISPQALVGGGRFPKPGEISLASRGVLFLDELPEFSKNVIELLRQPLEEHKITISRMQGACEFPANMMMVAAMNPCPCGFYPDRSRCRCTPWEVKRYLSKISKPILDRIDICVESSPMSYEDMTARKVNEPSSAIRDRVERARKIQQRRFSDLPIFFNSEMRGREIERYCKLGQKDEAFAAEMFESMGLSARGYHKILKVARTIADLEGADRIGRIHLCEAVGYRGLEDKYWGGTSNV